MRMYLAKQGVIVLSFYLELSFACS